MADAMYCIYKHTSPSGKAYIGQTNDLMIRNRNHRNSNSECSAFARAIRKYGWDAFRHETLEVGITLEQANKREVELIALHGSLSPWGYNLQSGGKNFKASDETRIKISAAMKGRLFSDDHRRKLSASMDGRAPSQKARELSILARTGQKLSSEHLLALLTANLGSKRSEESKAWMSVAQLGNKKGVGHRKSAEVRDAISRANSGKVFSDEHRAKLSAAKMGNTNRLGGVKLIRAKGT